MESLSAPARKSFFDLKRVTGLVLLILLSAIFLFSGISKLYSFHRFAWNIMDSGISNMSFAYILARLFIGFELLLGAFLLAHIFLRQFTYPAIIGLLILFTIYLLFLLLRQGNKVDCGCFGEELKMTPLVGILKNLLMIGVTISLFYLYPARPYRNSEWISVLIGMSAIVMPFLFYPMSADSKPEVVNEPIDLSPLYHSKESRNIPPSVDLSTGKHIVAFMSLTCSHCKKAAFLLQVIHRKNPDFPIYMVLNGHPDFLKDFFDETHSFHVPHTLFKGSEEFLSMAGSGVPAIYWINNSVIERKSTYYQLDPKTIQAWLRK
jgi:uncharacterized membrane protein YphA (DoxX/SURF4 family)